VQTGGVLTLDITEKLAERVLLRYTGKMQKESFTNRLVGAQEMRDALIEVFGSSTGLAP
jgi:hypothetical protein